MKNIIFILPLLFWSPVKSNKDLNISTPYKDTVILLGPADQKGFKQEPFNEWFNINYQEYKVDKSAVEELSSLSKDILK